MARQKEFFSAMVVDAVMQLDELLPLNMIGIKKVQGGGLEVGGRRCSHLFRISQFFLNLKLHVNQDHISQNLFKSKAG